MIYPQNIESKIGFDAIRRMVAERCGSPLSVALVEEMSFSSNYEAVVGELRRVSEFCTILQDDDFPGTAFRDVTARLKSIRPEGTFLTASEFVDLGYSLSGMASIEAFFRKHRNEEGLSPYPGLDLMARQLTIFPYLASAIDRTIDRWGQIKDTASPELSDIRRRLSSMGGTINSVMRRVIANAQREGYLDADCTASIRDGRLVLPVAPMYKRRIPGIVHDESASGNPVFIGPAEVVEANNRQRELHIEERREELRAKAEFAIACEACLPHIANKPDMEWYSARHPVLQESLTRQNKSIVPLDIRLSESDRILVISGPNAGGKSVTLKTVAVVQYMVQCGLLPPLYDNSHLGIFDDIFIDIGDDQSIEDDLSTYSSHLRNMRFLHSRGGNRTLMLIDEFGSGTEPQIGGAIAQALLAEFNAKGMWGVVTTHFQKLIKAAEETAGLINGAMLYDRQQMRPLFKLTIGSPGSSFAIEIARKTGLPESIIAAASEIVGSDYVNLDKYLLDIARDRRYWENKRMQIRQKEKRIEEVLAKYEDDADSLRQRRNEIIAEARQEARKILDGSNAAIERTIHDIKRAQAERDKTLEARRRLAQERHSLTEGGSDDHPLLPKTKRKKQAPKAEATTDKGKALAVGDNVLLDGAGTVGTIEQISGKNAVVIFGQLKTTVKLSRLTHTIRKPQSGAKAASFMSVATSNDNRERQLRFKPEIDIRGMRVDEAIQAVTYFIDDAIQFNSSRVRVLHGTGTGALRQVVREYLQGVPSVRYFADEDVRLGGAGITVIEF